jgi:hypothetical protein
MRASYISTLEHCRRRTHGCSRGFHHVDQNRTRAASYLLKTKPNTEEFAPLALYTLTYSVRSITEREPETCVYGTYGTLQDMPTVILYVIVYSNPSGATQVYEAATKRLEHVGDYHTHCAAYQRPSILWSVSVCGTCRRDVCLCLWPMP